MNLIPDGKRFEGCHLSAPPLSVQVEDQDELPFLACHLGEDVADSAPVDAFLFKGHIAGQQDLLVLAKDGLHFLQHFGQPVGGIHQDQWDIHGFVIRQEFLAPFGLARRKTGEHEAGDWEKSQRESAAISEAGPGIGETGMRD